VALRFFYPERKVSIENNLPEEVMKSLRVSSASFLSDGSETSRRHLAKRVLRVMQEKIDTMPNMIGFTISWTGHEVTVQETHKMQFETRGTVEIGDLKEVVNDE
jgi:hypothetical protein